MSDEPITKSGVFPLGSHCKMFIAESGNRFGLPREQFTSILVFSSEA